MVYDFEGRMELYRQQIEEMESHLVSLNQPSMVTPQGREMYENIFFQLLVYLQFKTKILSVLLLKILFAILELTLLLSKLHESFVGLAAQLHVVHEMVKVE